MTSISDAHELSVLEELLRGTQALASRAVEMHDPRQRELTMARYVALWRRTQTARKEKSVPFDTLDDLQARIESQARLYGETFAVLQEVERGTTPPQDSPTIDYTQLVTELFAAQEAPSVVYTVKHLLQRGFSDSVIVALLSHPGTKRNGTLPSDETLFIIPDKVLDMYTLKKEESKGNGTPTKDHEEEPKSMEERLAQKGDGDERVVLRSERVVPDESIALTNTQLYLAQCFEYRLRNEGLFDPATKHVRLHSGEEVIEKGANDIVSQTFIASILDVFPSAISNIFGRYSFFRAHKRQVIAYDALLLTLLQTGVQNKYSVREFARIAGANEESVKKIFARGDFSGRRKGFKPIVKQKQALAESFYDAIDALLEGRTLLKESTDEKREPAVDPSLIDTEPVRYLAQCLEQRVRMEGLWDYEQGIRFVDQGRDVWKRRDESVSHAFAESVLDIDKHHFSPVYRRMDYLRSRRQDSCTAEDLLIMKFMPPAAGKLKCSVDELATIFGTERTAMQRLQDAGVFKGNKRRFKPVAVQRRILAEACYLVLDALDKGETLLTSTSSYKRDETPASEAYAA